MWSLCFPHECPEAVALGAVAALHVAGRAVSEMVEQLAVRLVRGWEIYHVGTHQAPPAGARARPLADRSTSCILSVITGVPPVAVSEYP